MWFDDGTKPYGKEPQKPDGKGKKDTPKEPKKGGGFKFPWDK